MPFFDRALESAIDNNLDVMPDDGRDALPLKEFRLGEMPNWLQTRIVKRLVEPGTTIEETPHAAMKMLRSWNVKVFDGDWGAVLFTESRPTETLPSQSRARRRKSHVFVCTISGDIGESDEWTKRLRRLEKRLGCKIIRWPTGGFLVDTRLIWVDIKWRRRFLNCDERQRLELDEFKAMCRPFIRHQ